MPIEIWGLTGQQSAFTNTSVFDKEYLEALFGGSEFPNGEFMVDYLENIMDFQKLYMEVMSDIRSENMFTFPVSTISSTINICFPSMLLSKSFNILTTPEVSVAFP